MDTQKARKLRSEWFGRPCDHSTVEQETGQEAPPRACVCTTCGAEFAKKEVWEKLRANTRVLVYQGQS